MAYHTDNEISLSVSTASVVLLLLPFALLGVLFVLEQWFQIGYFETRKSTKSETEQQLSFDIAFWKKLCVTLLRLTLVLVMCYVVEYMPWYGHEVSHYLSSIHFPLS